MSGMLTVGRLHAGAPLNADVKQGVSELNCVFTIVPTLIRADKVFVCVFRTFCFEYFAKFWLLSVWFIVDWATNGLVS